MSRASNSLKTSDVSVTPIKLKYSASYQSGSTQDAGIELLTGVNGSISTTGSVPDTTLLYRSVRHLYYSNYLTGSYQVSASYADNWLQSTAASGTLEADRRYFPTGSNAVIKVVSIPREVFGEKVSRRSFRVVSDTFDVRDDGNGNIWDAYGIPGYIKPLFFQNPDLYFEKLGIYGVHVGNVLYAQGIVIVTNEDYEGVFGDTNYLLTEDSEGLITEDSEKIIIEP